jgi:hypothetical protein
MKVPNEFVECKTFRDEMLKILYRVSDTIESRKCKSYSYKDHLTMGVERVLLESPTGRGFVQDSVENGRINKLSVRTFFSALESNKRLEYIMNVNKKLIEMYTPVIESNLCDIPELDNFDIKIGDGHFHKHATHEEKINNKAYAIGHMYFLDARTHLIQPVGMMKDSLSSKKRHDIKLLQKHKNKLRFDAPIGRKVMIVYDRASIDFHLWWQLKKSKGVYFLSMEKSNMKLKKNILGNNKFDKKDSRNTGIISDLLCGCHAQVLMRRIEYIDPESGKKFVFVTNEMSLPPGVIAFLYKLRWDIEKKFDFFKNAMNEKKSWSKSLAGKKQQALFLCIAHNLLTVLEYLLKEKYNIIDSKCIRRREKKIKEYINKMKEKKLPPNPLIVKLRKLSKFSLQFFRTIKNKYFHFS